MSRLEPLSIQAWSWVYVITGCAMVLAAHWLGVPTDIGAGIIGAGIGAFTQITHLNSKVEHATNVNVNSDPQKKD
jgi:hypothetical protein